MPAFSAASTGATNVTGNSTLFTIPFGTELYDRGNDFNSSQTFTAPITGIYHFSGAIQMSGLTSNHTNASLFLTAAGVSYSMYNQGISSAEFGAGTLALPFATDVLVSGGQTAIVQISVVGASSGVDIVANNGNTWFTGHLIG